jgi:hypothetical protein
MKKEELLKNEITAIELSIEDIKKDVEIIKYLTDSANGLVMNIKFLIEDIEEDLKKVKELEEGRRKEDILEWEKRQHKKIRELLKKTRGKGGKVIHLDFEED